MSLRTVLGNPSFPLVLVAAVAVLVHSINILNYPAWFFDEGFYLTFSNQWAKTGQLSYFEHPFGAFVILALLFATVNPTSYLIPRILMALFSAVDGVLLYKVARAAYSRTGMFAFVASLLYVATPLSARYLRLVLVDNFMTLFLLLALLVIVTRPTDQVVSALLFGGALVSKQTGLFFIPAVLALFRQQKRSLSKTILWLFMAAIIPVLWVLFGIYQIGFSSLLSSQLVLTGLSGERAAYAGDLIVQRITARDPFVFIGLAGVLWSIYRRDVLVAFPISYLLSFIILFLKISTVYLIPMIPFFSILGTALLFDLFERIPRLKSFAKVRTYVFTVLVVALIVSSLFLAVFQNPATPQQEALAYVVDRHPQGVIVSHTYLWLFTQNYPRIVVYDRYSVPWDLLHNETVYLMVDYPGDLVTINSIPQYHDLYFANSTQKSLKAFVDSQSGYEVQVLYGTIP